MDLNEPTSCSHYGYGIIRTQYATGSDSAPAPGKFCIACGEVSIFTDTPTLRKLSQDELSEVRAERGSLLDSLKEMIVKICLAEQPETP
jgi:hypothetical protein